MTLRSLLPAALSLLALALGTGCAMSSEETGDTEEDISTRPQMSICFSGRSLGSNPYDSGGNSELGALCKKLPGLVQDVGGHDAAYPFFRWDSNVDHALDVLVHALDTNHDGVVTNMDTAYDLNVVGYSWGGFNARDLIKKIETDRRFSPSRHGVARFFAVDPYRTDVIFARAEMEVPGNVGTLYEFRHTVAPEVDCSRIAWGLIGPFTGRTPECTGTTVCHDYDYSLQNATKKADHCGIPSLATHPILQIMANQTPTGLPPEHKVARY
jgi:hypothetical protein